VSSNVLGIFWQVVAQKGAWEEVFQGIKHNEPKMIKLDISTQNIEHQLEMKSKIIMKKINED